MLRKMATQLPELAAIERLSPRVLRILGGNPSKVQSRKAVISGL